MLLVGVNCRCFDTLRTKVGHRYQKTLTLRRPLPPRATKEIGDVGPQATSSDHRIVFLRFQFQEDGKDKENKVLGCEDCI